MKKITFLFILLITSLGFSQEIVINGDFETGAAAPDWAGNGAGANVVDDGSGSNFVNAAIITGSTEVWQTNLQQVLALTENESYELSFDAYATANSTIIAGIGKNGGDFANSSANPDLTTTSQTFVYTFAANFDTVTDGSRVFFDMGGAANNDGRTIYIDNVSLMAVAVAPTCDDGIMNGDETGIDCGGSCPNACPTCTDGIMNGNETGIDCGGPDCAPCIDPEPAVAAPTPPARAPADVISIFSDAYAGVTLDELPTVWSDLISFETLPIGGNDTWKINGEFLGMVTNYAAGIDLSLMTTMHIDYWTEDTNNIDIKLVNTIAAPVEEDLESLGATVTGSWQSIEIDMTGFATRSSQAVTLDQITQILIDPSGPALLYVDNFYFYKGVPLSNEEFTATDFTVYPNPTLDNWNIKGNQTINSVVLFDVLGKEVVSLTPNAKDVTIESTSLNSGLYFARINSDSGTKTVKLVKE